MSGTILTACSGGGGGGAGWPISGVRRLRARRGQVGGVTATNPICVPGTRKEKANSDVAGLQGRVYYSIVVVVVVVVVFAFVAL